VYWWSSQIDPVLKNTKESENRTDRKLDSASAID
jgi:hypothetical protein